MTALAVEPTLDHRHSARGWRSGNGCEGCRRARREEVRAGRRSRCARVVLRPVDRGREATGERRRRAAELRAQRLTNVQIAQHLGVTDRTVTRYLSRTGTSR